MSITINTVKWASPEHGGVIVNDQYFVPNDTNNRHWVKVEAWVNEGNFITPEDPAPPPPTNQELVDMAGPVLLAFLKAYAAREGLTLAQIRNAVVAQM